MTNIQILKNDLLKNMPAMVFSKDAETGKYLTCNQSFAEYAHRESPEKVAGLTDFDIFDAVTAAHFVADDKKAGTIDEPYVFIEDVPDAKGNPRHFQTTKIRYVDGNGRPCTLGLCVDVTVMSRVKAAEAEDRVKNEELSQRLALEQQLKKEEKQSEQQNMMITALASDYRSVYHVDLDSDAAVCYRADPEDHYQHPQGEHFRYLEAFTYYAENFVDENYREGFLKFIEPDNIRASLADNLIISYRYLARREGKEYYEMIRMAGVRHAKDRDDHIVHAVGLGLTVIDEEMRETMTRNQVLRDALISAEEASKAKTAFLSNMSHEIRTPMNAIIGLNSLAMRDESLSDQARDYLEKIGDSARHLLGLINDILDMSRIESGRLVIRREEFSFEELMSQICNMVMPQCSDKGLEFEYQSEGSPEGYYIGDDMKLRQVLINILSNAIKFTDAPGKIILKAEQTTSFDSQSAIKFTISDTGIGMSREFLPRVFDSFTQEDSTRSSKYGSTGLGMAITKNIVEMMNGTIQVESELGVGSVFTVVLTLKKSEHEETEVKLIHPNDLNVLVVDDDEVAAEHARMILDEAGIKADTASGGREALDMLEIRHTKMDPYNLVLLDWKMPEMDGLETARLIRERYDNETTVIIVTAYNWEEIMEEALFAGVDSFLAKPLFAANILEEFEHIARKNNLKILNRKKTDLKGRRILLAEDMIINMEIIKQLLAIREISVDHAENGRVAVDMFANSAEGYYDAVLMDIRMPVMDGLEAASAIRALEREDAGIIPIIALTANAFDEDVQKSLQVGMNAHLTKPVEPEILYSMLEDLINEI